MPQPTKQQVRDYMERRRADRRAPPDMKQIRRELGWELTEIERRMHERRTADKRDDGCSLENAATHSRAIDDF